MKCKQYFLLILLLLLSAACSQENESQGQHKKNNEEYKSTVAVAPIEEKTEKQEKNEHVTGEMLEKTEIIGQVPQYKINPENFNIDPIQDATNNVVLLTIDDAPDKNALEMAKTLKSLNVNAIFFVNGHFLAKPEQKAVLKEIHDMGFLIGNHTMTHENLKKLSEEEQNKEIVELNNLVEEITGERPKFFRAPFGANTDYSKQLAADEKMVLMNWSYGYDFMKDYMSKDALIDIMINTELLHNGANLLMHDRQWTRDALKDIVFGLQNKGYGIADPLLIETLK